MCVCVCVCVHACVRVCVLCLPNSFCTADREWIPADACILEQNKHDKKTMFVCCCFVVVFFVVVVVLLLLGGFLCGFFCFFGLWFLGWVFFCLGGYLGFWVFFLNFTVIEAGIDDAIA